MEILDPAIDLTRFHHRLLVASKRILLLDYDGTIAPFRTDRERAVPYTGVTRLLNELMLQRHSRLVIVTGRSIDDVIPLLDITPLPEIWGSHGMEHRFRDGRYEIVHPDTKVPAGALAATQWAQANGLLATVEQKPFGIAFHWRGMVPDACDRMAAAIRQAWEVESARYGMILTRFDGGLELRAKEMNKGRAVLGVLADAPEDSVAAYLGDDFTDEDAFAAIKGRGLAVLMRSVIRETTADIWLTPPTELVEFLNFWLHPDIHRPAWLANNGRPKLTP